MILRNIHAHIDSRPENYGDQVAAGTGTANSKRIASTGYGDKSPPDNPGFVHVNIEPSKRPTHRLEKSTREIRVRKST